MSRRVLRLLGWLLAGVHLFPVVRHVGAFVDVPSLDEGWKGFGAVLAAVLLVLPAAAQARLFRLAWRQKVPFVVLAVAHAVPMLDHLPRFFAQPSWADAWRGWGSLLAVTWFAVLTVRALADSARSARRPPALVFGVETTPTP